VHVPGQRRGAAIAADLGGGQRVGLIAGAEAAMLLGNGDAEQARAMQVPVILGREFGLAVVRRRARVIIPACSSLSRNAAGSKIGESRLISSTAATLLLA
jgi:hypothetical protein